MVNCGEDDMYHGGDRLSLVGIMRILWCRLSEESSSEPDSQDSIYYSAISRAVARQPKLTVPCLKTESINTSGVATRPKQPSAGLGSKRSDPAPATRLFQNLKCGLLTLAENDEFDQ